MENTFNTEHIPLRTHEIQDTIFREHVPFSFFYSREKILCVHIFFIGGIKFYAGFPIFPIFCRKKKDFKIRFLEYGAVVNTRRPVLLYINMLVRNGGFFYRCPAFEKAYFQILFFSQKKGKKGNPRIEFSPANKKKRREHVL